MSALTKILIVLQLVFSLACSVLLVLMVSKTENYKQNYTDTNTKYIALGATYNKTQADKIAADAAASEAQNQARSARTELSKTTSDLAAAVSKAEIDKLILTNQITTLTGQTTMLNTTIKLMNDSIVQRDKDLADLRLIVPDLTKKYGEVNRANMELNTQLIAAEKTIKNLQIMVAQGSGNAGAIAPTGSGDQIQVLTTGAASGKVNSQISEVTQSAGRTLIEMPMGTRDGIKVGTQLYVYRANSYVGDATVQRVTADQSVATVMKTKTGEAVLKGDYVRTLGE